MPLKNSALFFIFTFGLQSLACNLVFAEEAYVKRVIDGDTVVLEDETRVRLIGIDAPEIENKDYAHRGEPYGEEAKQVLKKWLEGKRAELRNGPGPQDRYGRRLAYLFLADDFFINLKLVEAGAARAYRKFPHPFQAEFIRAEATARQNRLGLWAVESRPPTWWERLWGRKS